MLGELSALLTAFLWSGGAVAFASATERIGSLQVNVTRLILATLFFVALIALMGFDLGLSDTQVLNLSVSGVIGIALGDTFLFMAFQKIGARVTMLIMSLAPAIASVLAYSLLGETLTVIGVCGIALTILGVCIVVFDRGGDSKRAVTASGIVCGVLAAAGQGVGLVFAKLAFSEAELDGFVGAAVRIIASLAVLLPFAVLTGRYGNPLLLFAREKRAFRLIVLGSILGPFLGISFSLIAIKHTKVGIAATIMALVPVLILPIVRIVHKEKLTWRAVVGACTAVAGVAVLFLT